MYMYTWNKYCNRFDFFEITGLAEKLVLTLYVKKSDNKILPFGKQRKI